ncbi:MAG: hypothetical protein Q9224_002626 [Gallowayella concinna]
MSSKPINRSQSNPPGSYAYRHNAPDNDSFSVDPLKRASPVRKTSAPQTGLVSNRNEAPDNNSSVLEPTKCFPAKYQRLPTRMNVPAKRKADPASTEKRITRAKKTQPMNTQKPFEASLLARAHLRTSRPGLQNFPIDVDAPASNEEAASSTRLDPALRVIQPKPVHVPMSTILGHNEPPNLHCTTLDHGAHPHKPTSPAPAIPTKDPLPWYSHEIATSLIGLPMRKRVHLATYPFTSPRCALTRETPHDFNAISPLPKGFEIAPYPLPKIIDVPPAAAPPPGSPVPETLDQENFVRSIVTYRRLGFRFDEIAKLFHRAGLPAEIVTEGAVEGIWKETRDKDFGPWYGESVQQFMVFERDDPTFQVREG